MSSSEGLSEYVRVVAHARGLALRDEWVPDVTLHLKRLLEAAELLERCDMTSPELAPRFEP